MALFIFRSFLVSPQITSAYLSEKQAAAFLSVSLSTIRRWRRANIGPAFFRFGGVLRYSVEHLKAFVTKNQNSHE